MGLLDTARVGDMVERKLIISEDLMAEFAKISGDINPLHTSHDFAQSKGFSGRVAYGNILNLIVSSIVGMDLKDDHVMLLSQRIDYKKPILINDEITATGTISNISNSVNVIEMKLQFKNQSQDLVAKGSCSLKCI